MSDLGPDGDAPAEENARERPRVLIERWVLRHDADDADEGPRGETSIDRSHRQNPSPSKPGRTSAETTAVAYKRTVVMVRALHALCRSLPANRFHRAARQSQCRGLRFAMAHEIRAGGEGGDSTDAVVVKEEKPSGGDFGEYSFTPVRTPAGGSLRATVYFLDARALAGMDCVPTPVAPRVIDGYLGGGGGGGAVGGGGAHPTPPPFPPPSHSSASPSPFSPASAAPRADDAPAPPRRDFGFGTSPSSGGGNRPFRQNSWAGKATYGFGASPPARAGLPASPVGGTGDGSSPGGGLQRQGSRGMLSEAIAEQKASEEGGGVPAPAGAAAGGASRGESARSSTKPPPSPPQIYGFGVGSLGTATATATTANFAGSPRPGSVSGSPSLPFASTSHPTRFTPDRGAGSGPKGGGFSTSLASTDHALARRARESAKSGDGSNPGSGGGSRPQSARGGVDDSPPWHFRGLTGALSASPGSTPGGGTTPRGSHGSHGERGAGAGQGQGQSNSAAGAGRSNPIGVYYASPGRRPRRPSWSSPSSSLSASLHGDASGAGGGGIGSLVGGALSAPLGTSPGRHGFAGAGPYSHGGFGFNGAPFSYGGAPYSYGASPGASPGGSFANAMAHLRAQRAGQGAGAGAGSGVASTGIQQRGLDASAGDGARRIPDSYAAMFESGADSDPLPFALDDEDEGSLGFDPGSGGGGASTGGGIGGIGSSIESRDARDGRDREGSSHGSGTGGASGRSDAAVGALVRMLQDAAPLSAEWGNERVGDTAGGGSAMDSSRDVSGSSSGDAVGGVDAGVGGEMTLDWALSQLSRFRDFKASLDESTSTLEAVEERPNGEEGGTE